MSGLAALTNRFGQLFYEDYRASAPRQWEDKFFYEDYKLSGFAIVLLLLFRLAQQCLCSKAKRGVALQSS